MFKKTKHRITAAAIAVGVGLVGSVIAAAPASATDYSINVNTACVLQHGNSWRGYLLDAGNAYSWRCVTPPYYNAQRNVDFNIYCSLTFPGTYAVVLDPSNAYSWRCRG